MSQFEKMRAFYERKLAENAEIKKLDDCLRSLFKENAKLKQQLLSNKENCNENTLSFDRLNRENEVLKAIVAKQKTTLGELGKKLEKIEKIEVLSKNNEKKEKNEEKRGVPKEIKEKLKLDLEKVRLRMQPGLKELEELEKINNGNIICFHDEFMAKFDEFSTSWKGEAQKNVHKMKDYDNFYINH